MLAFKGSSLKFYDCRFITQFEYACIASCFSRVCRLISFSCTTARVNSHILLSGAKTLLFRHFEWSKTYCCIYLKLTLKPFGWHFLATFLKHFILRKGKLNVILMNTILTVEDIKWLLKSSAAVLSTMVQSI